MDFDTFKEELTKLYKYNQVSNGWLDKLPTEVSDAFFDNPHVDALLQSRDSLIRLAFGDLAEEVFWVLDEFVPGEYHRSIVGNKEYDVISLEDYFESVKSLF